MLTGLEWVNLERGCGRVIVDDWEDVRHLSGELARLKGVTSLVEQEI